jgi:TPR repeat protein
VGLGVLLEQGTEKHPPERERAAQLYRQACDEGERQGCLHLGQLYQRGEGAPLDEVQAFVLFQRACERGHPLGCRLAGEATATGRGVLRDEARAVAFFRSACRPDEGAVADAEGCAWLAVHLRDGKGVARDPAQAEELRQRACELGATLGCAPAALPSTAAPTLSAERPPQTIHPPTPR